MPKRIKRTWPPAGIDPESPSGVYYAYVPDPLVGSSPCIPGALATRAGELERALLAFSRPEQIGHRSPAARFVAANIATLQLVESRALTESWSIDLLVELKTWLLGGIFAGGLRDRQNWLGGFYFDPLDAVHVPPPAEEVPALMGDLIDYTSGAEHGALIQAGLAHAQFETIHPFADGNGRVGRTLIHEILRRRNINRDIVLPVSVYFAAHPHEYGQGLNAYREGTDEGIARWLDVFLEAVEYALAVARVAVADVDYVRADLEDSFALRRIGLGKPESARPDSVSVKILDVLPARPVLTPEIVALDHGVSLPPARRALVELTGTSLLQPRDIGRRRTAYLSAVMARVIDATSRCYQVGPGLLENGGLCPGFRAVAKPQRPSLRPRHPPTGVRRVRPWWPSSTAASR